MASNPVFSRSEAFGRRVATPTASDLQSLYDAPAATAADTDRMTIDDVVTRTGALFAVLVGTAALAWGLHLGLGVGLVAALVGLGLAMFVSLRRSTNPVPIVTYAALEGVFVGAISRAFQESWHGVVPQAVLGTLVTFAVVLGAYRFGWVRATPRFVRMVVVATASYVVLALASLVSAFFGVGHGWGFYGVSGFGLLLCALGVALAAFNLVVDFGFVEQGIRNEVPARYAWQAAFGLLVTLVWLYLEILRMLAIRRN